MVENEKEIIVQFRIDTDELSHAICMGIRKGLFGASAGDNESIHNINFIEEEVIYDVLREIKDALKHD